MKYKEANIMIVSVSLRHLKFKKADTEDITLPNHMNAFNWNPDWLKNCQAIVSARKKKSVAYML